jgi:hypothetical protein
VHTVDVALAVLAVLAVAVLCALLARQTYMLRSAGAIPAAAQLRESGRWQYGIIRYVGSQLRWYRALGLGSKPTRVLSQGEVSVVGRRSPRRGESGVLPTSAVIVEVRDRSGTIWLALGESAYTGFVSWTEASSPANERGDGPNPGGFVG